MIAISGYLGEIFDPGYEDKQNYITVYCSGYNKYITKDLQSLIRHRGRLDYQLLYIASGKGRFMIDNQIHDVNEGKIVLYRPHELQYYSYSHKDSTEVYWIHFSGYGAESLLTGLGFCEGHVFEVGMNSKYGELFNLIINELQLKRTSFTQLSAYYFLEMLTIMSRKATELKDPLNGAERSTLFEIIELIHRQFNKNIPIKEYAKLARISESWFIKKFRELTGMPPQEYITQIRINKAKELLCSSSLNIAEISSIIGYENPLYFSRVFHNMNGVSPSTYRKTH